MKTLLERHFDTAFDAPDGIKRLRELILSLAMQGKLVKQDPSDPPASELLKEIDAEKKRLIKAGKIKQPKPLPPIKPEEVPYELPKSWEWVRLGMVSDYNGRRNIFGDAIDPDTWVLDLEDIEKETSRILCRAKFSERQSKSSKSTFLKGDVLYGKLRPYLDKVVVADSDGVCTTEIVPIVPCKGISPEFLRWLLKRPAFLNHVSSLVYGVKMPRLGSDDAVMSVHPLPPLVEQHRIVAKIDQLMARCDVLEKLRAERDQKRLVVHAAAIRQLLDPASLPSRPQHVQHFLFSHFPELYTVKENVAELRKAILQLAVMGKLVPQDPKDESAEDGLARIAATKLRLQKTGEIGKDKPIEPLQHESIPFEVPESWRWAKLAELTELITKGSSPKWQGVTYVPKSEGVLFITSENVGNYVLRKLDDLKYVAKRFNEIEPRSILKRGDILMNLVGASIGRTAVYDLQDGANINQAVALIRLVRETDGVCPRFLLHYLNSPSAIDYMLSSRVVNAQPNISLTDAREFAVPIPPLAEQHRIVAKIDQLMALCDAMENQITSATAKQTTLLTALMARV